MNECSEDLSFETEFNIGTFLSNSSFPIPEVRISWVTPSPYKAAILLHDDMVWRAAWDKIPIDQTALSTLSKLNENA